MKGKWQTLFAIVAFTVGLGPAGAQVTPSRPCPDCCPDPPCDPLPPYAPPQRLVFFYPWWDGVDPNTGTPRPKWSDCINECQCDWNPYDEPSPYKREVPYHPDFNADGVFELQSDLYNDNSVATMVTHLQRMAYANVHGLISSWWGLGDPSDDKFMNYLFPAAVQVPSVDITWYYEAQTRDNANDPRAMRDFLVHAAATFAQNPSAFVRRWDERLQQERPVIFVYNPGNGDCAVLDAWKAGLDYAHQQTGVRPRLFLDMKNDLPQRCSNWSPRDILWHEYAPPDGSHYEETWVNGMLLTNTIRPGYWPICAHSPRSERLSYGEWMGLVRSANYSRPAYYQLVTSWNEWLENTAVEPGLEWQSSSTMGSFLDVLSWYPTY